MTRAEIEDNIRRLKSVKSTLTDQNQINAIDESIAEWKNQLKGLDEDEVNRTVGERIGSGIGRLSGIILGLFVGELDHCITGKDVKRTRGKVADYGETFGASAGGFIERIYKKIRGMK